MWRAGRAWHRFGFLAQHEGHRHPQFSQIVNFLCELPLQKFDFLAFRPSTVAASAVMLSLLLTEDNANWVRGEWRGRAAGGAAGKVRARRAQEHTVRTTTNFSPAELTSCAAALYKLLCVETPQMNGGREVKVSAAAAREAPTHPRGRCSRSTAPCVSSLTKSTEAWRPRRST